MIDPAQLNALYQLIEWDCRNRRTEAETTEMLRVSRYCIAAYTAEGALVGFARVCGDPYVAQVLARLYPFWTATERHGKLYNLYDHGRSSMFTVPKEFAIFMTTFAPLFTKRVWQHVQVLLIGAILSPGQRTVTAALRVMGLAQAKFFQKYHRVLNRAVWSSLEGARLLLVLLVSILAPTGPLIMGLDDTLERRRGAKIQAKGIDRDPVRSSHSHMVKASGLRWLSLMLLVSIPWAKRVWALPFFTVLAPSERYHQERGQRHKKLTDWARQMFLVVRRWLPERPLVVVTDSRVAVITLLWRICQLPNPICGVTRLRLDAALYEPAPPRTPRQTGRPRLKGKRLPTLAQVLRDAGTGWTSVTVRGWYREDEREVEITSAIGVWYHSGMPPLPIRWVLVRDPQGTFEPQALLCTDLTADPVQILEWFVRRWRLEVTWQEAHAHLGLETQRQWNERAIARTTPALLGLFSIVTLLAGRLAQEHLLPVRQAVWYQKSLPTFVDAIAIVRQRLWASTHFYMSPKKADVVEIPCSLLNRLTETLCYAA